MKKILMVLIGFVLFSCTSNSFKTDSGIKVGYVEKGDGNLPVDSLIGLYCIRYTTEDGRVLMDANPDNPVPWKNDPNNVGQQGELYEILSKLRTGDSVGFELVASELFEKTFQTSIPDSIAADSKIQFQISFIDQLTETGYYEMTSRKAEELAAKQLIIDAEILDNYLVENKIIAEKTESGLRYVITEAGTGNKPENGQFVEVDYAGWILDGEYFDTSIESVAKEKSLFQSGRPYQPYSFPLGQGRVIKGWDEGIALLNEGSKARLYIPSTLGYQSRGSGSIIKPNAILVFDVELVSIQ